MPRLATDQRTEVRVAPPENAAEASLRPLGDAQASHPHPIPVEIADISGRGLRVLAAVSFAPGTLVRIDWNRTMLLGEVCYAQPDGARFALGLRLEHSLLHTESLDRLRKRFTE